MRSALSLGKHLSWIISGSAVPCECDGCKSTSKAARVPRVAKEGGAAAKRKAKGKERASLWSGGTDDDDFGDDDGFSGSQVDGDDFDDESEASPKKKSKLAPSSTNQSQAKQAKVAITKAKPVPVFPLPPRHEFATIKPVREDPSDVKPKSRDDDLAHPHLSRQGELVWAELDLPEGTRTPITHWPAVVRDRVLVDGGGEVSADYSVQLLALNSLIKVEGLGLVPWLGYDEPTPAELVDEEDYESMLATLKTKWDLAQLLLASPATVTAVFLLAVHTAKWLATMQIRSCVLSLLFGV